jgi:hypothetical protein
MTIEREIAEALWENPDLDHGNPGKRHVPLDDLAPHITRALEDVWKDVEIIVGWWAGEAIEATAAKATRERFFAAFVAGLRGDYDTD